MCLVWNGVHGIGGIQLNFHVSSDEIYIEVIMTTETFPDVTVNVCRHTF